MNKKNINIEKGQWLSNILPEGKIPSNVILNKVLPNVGATHSEIIAERNSIIIVPNLPVISGKIAEMKRKEKEGMDFVFMLGVYEGIHEDAIMKYIKNESPRFKKIMSTPEGFAKIKSAMQTLGIDMYHTYFLLYDECHQIVQDVDFRENITYPLNDFFDFKGKAMISATPLPLFDPRFKNKDFTFLNVVPRYDYKKDVRLIYTINTVYGVYKIMKEYPNENICFFCNSVKLMTLIIDQLKIMSYTSIFCSDKARKKILENGYKKVYTNIDNVSKMSKFNFLTGRFFNAVDIKLNYQPVVVLLTDNHVAEQTRFDIDITAVQCVGRFRNGINAIIHISDTDRKIKALSKPEAFGYIMGIKTAYNLLNNSRNTTTVELTKMAIHDILSELIFSNFITPNGRLKYEQIANFINEEVVKGCYTSISNLREVYDKSKYFTFSYEHLPYFAATWKFLKPLTKADKGKQWKEIVDQLDAEKSSDGFSFYENSVELYEPFIYNAYKKLGKEKLQELGYGESQIKIALNELKFLKGEEQFAIRKEIYLCFKIGHKYPVSYVKEHLNQIYTKYGYFQNGNKKKAITAKKINDFFEVDNIRCKNERAIILIGEK